MNTVNKPTITEPSVLTKEMFEHSSKVVESSSATMSSSGGAGGSSSLNGLISLENVWNTLKNGGWKKEPTEIVSNKHILEAFKESDVAISSGNLESKPMYDIVVCGGTLGVFYAVAMQKLG